MDCARHGRAAGRDYQVVVGSESGRGGAVEARWLPVRGRSAWPESAGTSVGTAKNQLKTSKKVAKLPATEQALRTGRLSVAKAEAIAAAADVAPEAEDDLLDGAEDAPLAEVREKCSAAPGRKDRDAGARADPCGAVVQGVHRRRGRMERDRPRDRSRRGRRSGLRTGRSSTSCSRPRGPRAVTSPTRRTRSTRSSSSPAAPAARSDPPTREPGPDQRRSKAKTTSG